MIFRTTNDENFVNYIFEAQTLRLQKHTGWWHTGVKDPHSVAEHSHLVAVIAYVLAKMENYPYPEKIALKAIFHDAHEARLGDQHKISSRYYKIPKEVKKQVELDQCNLLGDNDLFNLLQDVESHSHDILKDADYLEMAFSAKTYLDIGYKSCQSYLERIEQVLKTKSAKKLFKQLKHTNSKTWWKHLKEPVESFKY